ncbi:MAG: hypothetical protein ABI767_16370 [Rhodanobacter sp.]
MSFLRTTTSIAFLLVTSVMMAGNVHATDVSMAGGGVTFSTPANWMGIMETQGDPEARVFQVPDPSPTGKNSLARVTVTVKRVQDINGFHQFMAEAEAKSMTLPGYVIAKVPPSPNSNMYAAQESGTDFSYVEHYWLKNGYAIQLRCVRPSQTLAGSSWNTEFDKGCESVAAQLK